MIFKDYYVQIPVNTINDNIVASVIQADHRSNRINATLIENRRQLDLTDASMVTVEIKKPNGSEVLGMADIIDPEKGRVRYTIMPGSIEVLGMHRLTFNVYSKDEDGEIINITSAYLFYDVREKLVVGDDMGESSEYPILIQLIQDINKIHEQYKEFEGVSDEIIIAEQERVQAEIERKQSEIDREQNEAKRELLYQQMDDLKNQLETIKTTLQGWLDNPEQFRGPEGPQGIQGIQGEVGPEGPIGKGLEYNWQSTQLGVRVEGEQEYTYQDLQGPPGNIDNLDKNHIETALGYIPANEDDLTNLAGVGRIDETVKDNADKIKDIITSVGNNEDLDTTEKTNLVLALNEVYQNLATHQAEKATQAKLGHIKLQEQFITGTLQNGWAGTIQYAKNDLGLVTVKGDLTVGTITADTIICTLPDGYGARLRTPIPAQIIVTAAGTFGMYASEFGNHIRVSGNSGLAAGQNIRFMVIYNVN